MSKIILTFAKGKTFNAYENHHIEQRNRDAAIGLWCLPGRPKGVRTPRAGGHRHGLSADRHRAGLPQRGRRGQRHAEVWRTARGAIHHYQDMGFQRRGEESRGQHRGFPAQTADRLRRPAAHTPALR